MRPRPFVYARLPAVPVNASPAPDLTSLYHKESPGSYGDRRYPGNCSGELIKDLLRYFRPRSVFDPMTGSGTCRDVCADLGIPCTSSDLHQGFDACDASTYPPGRFDFIWLHPPYWRQKIYSDDPRDLSNAPTLEAFLDRYRQLIENCTKALNPGGRLVILMGDYTDRDAGFMPLTYWTKKLGFDCGLKQPCTDIVRFSHGASSGKKVYRSAFIPGLHDVCVVLQKPRLGRDRPVAAPIVAPLRDPVELPPPDETPVRVQPLPSQTLMTVARPSPAVDPEVLLSEDIGGGSRLQLARSRRYRQLQVCLIAADDIAAEPDAMVQALQSQRWIHRPSERCWTKQFDLEAPHRTRAEAERIFRGLVTELRAQAGVETARGFSPA